MSQTDLRSMLDPRHTERLLRLFADASRLWLAIRDATGEPIASSPEPAPDSDSVSRVPVEVAGHKVGSIEVGGNGSERAEATAQIVAQVVADHACYEAELHGMADELLDRYEEVTLLYDLSQAMFSVLDEAAVCAIGLEKALQALGVRRAFVVLVGRGEGGEATMYESGAAEATREEAEEAERLGRGLSEFVAETGRQLLLHESERPPQDCEPQGEVPEAILSVPLTVVAGNNGDGAGDSTLGAITLLGKLSDERFTAGDAKLAGAIATQLATAVHNCRLIDSLRAAERMHREVEIAAGIQRSLLPTRPPELPGLALGARCVPAANVGGDYYDYLVDGEGRLCLLIADVAGHSIGSALMMAMARSVLRREISEGSSPAAVLTATNRVLFEDLVNSGLFITAFCACYDPRSRRLAYSNAGHNLPLLRRAGGEVEELDSDGAAIGILPDEAYEERETGFEPGDLLVMYTDGLVEAAPLGGEQFGDERLRRLVAGAGTLDPEALSERIFDAVRRHTDDAPRCDDETLLTLRAEEAL